MSGILKIWHLAALALVLSIISSTGYLFLRTDIWKAEPAYEPDEDQLSADGRTLGYSNWSFALAEAEDLIDGLREEISRRERELDAVARQVAQELDELQRTRAEIDKLREETLQVVIRVEASEERNIRRLADVYGGMRARDAVPILMELDLDLVVKILSAMPSADAAAILSELTRRPDNQRQLELAAEITARTRLLE